MKKLSIILMALLGMLALMACSTSTYIRQADGAVQAENGTVVLTFQPDGKTVLSESFVPLDQSNWITKAINGMTGAVSAEKMDQILKLMKTVP